MQQVFTTSNCSPIHL